MQTLARAIWKWLRYVLTDANNEWDAPLLMWFYACGVFLYKATAAPPPFDFMNFGAGAAGVFAAGKALDWFTRRHDKEKEDVGDQYS